MQETERCDFNPWIRKIPRRRAWQPAPVFLPRESHGQRSPEGYSCKVLDMTEATILFYLLIILYKYFSSPYFALKGQISANNWSSLSFIKKFHWFSLLKHLMKLKQISCFPWYKWSCHKNRNDMNIYASFFSSNIQVSIL